MRATKKRIAWTVFVLAILSWPAVCTYKLQQVYGIAKDTNSELIQYKPDSALPKGRVIEYELQYGYCRIVGFSCRDQKSFSALSQCDSIERVLVSDMNSDPSFCEALARTRASSVTLQDISIDINVSDALSQTNAKNVALLACQIANDERVYKRIEMMHLSGYSFIRRSSQPLNHIPIPRSTSRLFLVCSAIPSNLSDFVANSNDLMAMELWIKDFNNERLDWICDSTSLNDVVLRGDNCNLHSLSACSEKKRVVHALQ